VDGIRHHSLVVVATPAHKCGTAIDINRGGAMGCASASQEPTSAVDLPERFDRGCDCRETKTTSLWLDEVTTGCRPRNLPPVNYRKDRQQVHNTTTALAAQPIYRVTTARARQLNRYPEEVLRLVDLLGISHEFAADPAIEVRMAILGLLYIAREAEWAKHGRDHRNYDIWRQFSLTDALADELSGLILRERELSPQGADIVYSMLPRRAA
jgi:hypothetical protein